MNRAFSPSLVRPSLPLRRPATGPPLTSPRNLTPVFNVLGASLPKEGPQTRLDSLKAEASTKEDGVAAARDTMAGVMSTPSQIMMKLCNYCGQQGNLRCTRCKKTCYCSVTCQAEDWKAHRHICKPSVPEDNTSGKPKGSHIFAGGNGSSVSKVDNSKVDQPKRVYLRDLRKNSISKGNEVQGSVVELKSPESFFIHIHTVEMTETLKSITMELQKIYSSSNTIDYKPEIGEVCAVKFSLDQNWYRGEVKSVDLDRQTVKVLYIDFGNEEDVISDKIRPLAANIDAAPCALHCCVAGVTPVRSSWTGECCIAVKQLVAGRSLMFTVVDMMNDGTLLAVDAFLNTLGKNLSSFLIDHGYALKLSSPTKPRTKQDINSLLTASLENFMRSSGGKIENAGAQPPEPLTQKVGDTFTAIVTHLKSPSEIICQKLENASLIQQLQVGLREHCYNSQANENFRPAPGTVCCSLFSEDNQWYRAKVLAYSSEDCVCVGYIDFGNSEEVKLNNLRPISADLLALASQAIPCALADIKPASDVWSEEAILKLKHLVCNRFITVKILGERDGVALVSMDDESLDPQTNIAELLVATGHAAVGSMVTKVEEATTELASDAPAVGVQSVCKLEWSCAELPIDGQKVVLVVSVLENPGEFYCYNYNAKDLQILAELTSAVMKHCETERSPFSPTVGEPCCALFSGDGNWYRGMVQSVEADGKARLCFVDYGNCCEVDATHLRAIHPSLLKLPFQAIRCWLEGVEPVGSQWGEDAVKMFQALCVGKQLSGRVLSITERGYGVELECSGQNVADVLLSKQLARPFGQKNEPVMQKIKSSDLKMPPSQMSEPAEKLSPDEQSTKTTGQKDAPLESSPFVSFPLDWKTVKLPCNETFQPQVAAVISPSLFYVMNPREVDLKLLQAVMADVARYCSSKAESNQIIPQPGAACCAPFSGDKNWYRAVVLDTTSSHASVIYADYGNIERVPISEILPIPKELLKPPFQIARCALLGKEQFPTEWPPEVLELFGIQLSSRLLASVHDFDGTFNLLVLSQHTDHSGSNINSVILGALQKCPNKANTETQADEIPDLDGEQCTSSIGATGHTPCAGTEKPQMNLNEEERTHGSAEATGRTPSAPTFCSGCVALEARVRRLERIMCRIEKGNHTSMNEE